MPRGPAPNWRQRKEPILDHYIRASVEQVKGVCNSEGHYATLVHSGCETRDRAKEIKQALYRSGRHLGFSVHAELKKQGDSWCVEFKAIDKTMAKKYMLEKYGDDVNKWPYNPRRKGRD